VISAVIDVGLASATMLASNCLIQGNRGIALMSETESAGRAVAYWLLAVEALCNATPGSTVQMNARGTRVLTTGAHVASLNGLFVTTPEPDLDELSLLAKSYSRSTLPWSIQVRGDGASTLAVTEIAQQCGLTNSHSEPFMIRQLVETEMQWPKSAAGKLRRVPKEEHHTFANVLAAGFEAPAEIFRPLITPALLDNESMAAFFVEEAGVPVATSLGVLLDDHVGVFNISTRPSHRRRGHARAATAAVLLDAYARGARTAFLRSSQTGKAVYESMGFKTVENWRTYFAP
jgi:ribosomal protein S18 acetylase RimI-like enzyme